MTKAGSQAHGAGNELRAGRGGAGTTRHFTTMTTQTFDFQGAGVPSSSTVGTADATVFTLAKGEVGFVQNLNTEALALKQGADATTADFSMILQAGAAQDDGKGGFIYLTDYVGPVSLASMSGEARYIAWKRVLA